MKLKLEHVKNVDLMHGQGNGTGYWEPPIDPNKMVVEVTTLAEASKALCAWRERNGLGSGNIGGKCGEVLDGEKLVARISYNGRAWEPGKWPTKEIPLTGGS